MFITGFFFLGQKLSVKFVVCSTPLSYVCLYIDFQFHDQVF